HRRSMLFFFTHRAATVIYTLSLHDALPIYVVGEVGSVPKRIAGGTLVVAPALHVDPRLVEEPGVRGVATHPLDHHQRHVAGQVRSEEHTSELQSRENLVCRLLLEKKKKK